MELCRSVQPIRARKVRTIGKAFIFGNPFLNTLCHPKLAVTCRPIGTRRCAACSPCLTIHQVPQWWLEKDDVDNTQAARAKKKRTLWVKNEESKHDHKPETRSEREESRVFGPKYEQQKQKQDTQLWWWSTSPETGKWVEEEDDEEEKVDSTRADRRANKRTNRRGRENRFFWWPESKISQNQSVERDQVMR